MFMQTPADLRFVHSLHTLNLWNGKQVAFVNNHNQSFRILLYRTKLAVGSQQKSC